MNKNKRRRILIVDDEADTVLTLGIILEKSEFAIEPFTDPKAALRGFKPGYYDLVILDVRMPEVNGFELYSKLKLADPKIKAIFLTALTNLDSYDDFKKAVSPRVGERHFVQKPIGHRELLDQIYSILNSKNPRRSARAIRSGVLSISKPIIHNSNSIKGNKIL